MSKNWKLGEVSGCLDYTMWQDRKGPLAGPHFPLVTVRESPKPSKQLSVLLLCGVQSSVVSDSMGPHGLQHTRLPCPSPSLELTQTHVHWVGDAIQPSHPLSSPSPPAFNHSQHQGLFQWVRLFASVLEFQLHHQSFQWTFRTGFLYDGLVGSLAVQGTLKSLLQHHSLKASTQCFCCSVSSEFLTLGPHWQNILLRV